jgi:ribosomal protein S18 acetylase RimI-like enzyme
VPAAVLERFGDERAHLETVAHALGGEENVVLVAEQAGAVVGFALCLAGDGRRHPFLDSLHVADACRGRGLGTALLARLAGELVRRGHGTLELDVVEGNVGAGRLYERLGAERAGGMRSDWGGWEVSLVRYRWSDLLPLFGGPFGRSTSKNPCSERKPLEK